MTLPDLQKYLDADLPDTVPARPIQDDLGIAVLEGAFTHAVDLALLAYEGAATHLLDHWRAPRPTPYARAQGQFLACMSALSHALRYFEILHNERHGWKLQPEWASLQSVTRLRLQAEAMLASAHAAERRLFASVGVGGSPALPILLHDHLDLGGLRLSYEALGTSLRGLAELALARSGTPAGLP